MLAEERGPDFWCAFEEGEVVVIGDEPANTIDDRRRRRLLCRGAKESSPFSTQRSAQLVPDIVPIAFAEKPQPGWAVQLAFLLRTVELMTAVVAILALILLLGTWARDRLRRGAL
jgi:hypothetical protein